MDIDNKGASIDKSSRCPFSLNRLFTVALFVNGN